MTRVPAEKSLAGDNDFIARSRVRRQWNVGTL